MQIYQPMINVCPTATNTVLSTLQIDNSLHFKSSNREWFWLPSMIINWEPEYYFRPFMYRDLPANYMFPEPWHFEN